MGGGGFLTGDIRSPLDDLLLTLSPRSRPHVVFLATAVGDSERAIDAFHAAFAHRDCDAEAVKVFGISLELDGLDDGLGLLAGSYCPHFDSEGRRRPVYTRLVSEGFPAGVACDDGADLVEIVADRDGAYGYGVSTSGVEPIETRFLG